IGGSFENNTLNNVSIDFSNDTSHSKTKTLATLGEGNIQITDQTNSDTQMLNRDIANNEVNIYDIESHKGLQGELDTRLLTQDGRNQIAEDLKKTTFITNSLLEAATKDSVSLVGDRANGETGFFENVKNKTDLFEGTKKFVNDPENTQARDTLLNPNATPEELLQATQQLHSYVANEMGITPIELELILDTSYKGFTSSETGKAYLAINLHDTMGDVTNTTLNETSDVVDLQRDAGIEKTQNYTNNRDEYSTDFGNLGQELLNTQYSQTTGSSINNTSYNQVDASLQNHSSTIATNTQNFQTLDKSQGAHRQLNSAEINFLTNKKNIEEFAKIKYNTDNPTSEELQGAEHSLVQEGLRGVDKAWSLVLGTDTDTQAREYLSKNSDAFKAKDAYEFKDGTTNGEVEVSDLSKQDYEKLKTLYQNNVAYKTETNQEGARFLGEEYQTDTEKTLNNLKNIGIEEVNQAIRDFVPNTIEAITDTPQIANSAKNYLGNILPSTTQERMNELYMQGDAGSKTQANLATMDTIGTASMITGVGAVGKNAVESVGNSAVKSVDDSLQINTNFVSASGNPVELVKVGSKSDWDKTINKEFKPNTAYQLDNGHTYVTNTNGNVDFVEADLSKITMDRNNYQQSNVGRSGNIGDQGGHLIASSLGGAGDKINLVPMASVLNNGTWKKMESDLAKALDAGKNVSVKIDVGYPDGGGVRPNSFTVNYSIDGGKPITKEFEQ
ncbi:MAG: DNA/RNA non-specific endonuclease, partial [Arcobacteraceae bacterium]